MSSSAIPVYRAAPEAEIVRGARPYRDVLCRLHDVLAPRVYVEIGVRHGHSLALARSEVIVGVDPVPELQAALPAHAHVVAMTSDAYFASSACTRELSAGIDLAFIDGMHLFEFALRDFMHVERHASANGIVVFDDIFPNHPLQARRVRESGVWTGDVWKIVECLRTHRPDLALLALDTNPTGLLLVANLDPGNQELSRRYAHIVGRGIGDADPPPAILMREGALAPTAAVLSEFLRSIRK